MVQVHYGEGLANHTGPESCAVYREVCGEALTGERAGQPLSRETFLIQDADVVALTLPSRRKFIEKEDGRQRRLGIASLEDEIVQRAAVEVLNAIYEQDFLGFSYGFRPGRGQHDALDALGFGIVRTKASWIVDADVRTFFDSMSHD
jgi:reverse transcriptase-like protein